MVVDVEFVENLQNCTELELLTAVIAAEARGEPYEGMVAVGTIAMNRVQLDGYPDTLKEVLLQKGQFARPYFIESPEECKRAAQEVLSGVRNLPSSADMFQRAKVNKWYGRKPIKKVGAHWFYGRG